MKFRWHIVIEASEALVADGFDVANQIGSQAMGGELSALGKIVDWWRPEDCRVTIIDAPNPADLLRAQGYSEAQIAARAVAK